MALGVLSDFDVTAGRGADAGSGSSDVTVWHCGGGGAVTSQ
jgi:hypothetical protein